MTTSTHPADRGRPLDTFRWRLLAAPIGVKIIGVGAVVAARAGVVTERQLDAHMAPIFSRHLERLALTMARSLATRIERPLIVGDVVGVRSTLLDVVARCAGVSRDGVGMQTRLVDDLAMDSLDFVDLLFQLEEAFEVRLQGSDLDALTRLDFGSKDVVRDGLVTDAVLDRLRPFLPALPTGEAVTPRGLYAALTVESLWLALPRVERG